MLKLWERTTDVRGGNGGGRPGTSSWSDVKRLLPFRFIGKSGDSSKLNQKRSRHW